MVIMNVNIKPARIVKILGVILDTKHRFREQATKTASKGIQAAYALKRLNGRSPRTSRQLFVSKVTPIVDYAAPIWANSLGGFYSDFMLLSDRTQQDG